MSAPLKINFLRTLVIGFFFDVNKPVAKNRKEGILLNTIV
nr:MAG TPA: hypothetical protein [Caudoviricetes sp.]